MFHSSAVPVATPSSFVIGLIAYWIAYHLGFDANISVAIATKVAGFTNLGIGIPKNAFMMDPLSLVFVRPASFLGVLWALHQVL
jgi:hypothetical protein